MERVNYTTKKRDNGDGTFTLKVHSGHIHYKDGNGNLQDSEIVFEELADRFAMKKHNYQLEVAKDFAAPLLIRYTNKYEGANHTITYEPYAIAWFRPSDNDLQVFRNQQSVQGVYDKEKSSVYYTGAFGNGIDFEISLQRSGFTKEIVLPKKPAQFPTAPSSEHHLVALFKYGGSALRIIKDVGSEWDRENWFEHEGGFELQENTNPIHKSFIRPAYAVDSSEKEPARISLRVAWLKRNNQLWQIKEIPLQQMQKAIFPVRFDTTTSYNSESGDGVVHSDGASNWSNAVNGIGGTISVSDTTAERQSVSIYNNVFFWRCWRAFYFFDTSAIGSGSTISSATFNFYGYKFSSAVRYDAYLVSHASASDTALVAGDYTSVGSTSFGVATLATEDTWTGLNVSLNASGLSNINQTGISKFTLRGYYDFNLITPPAENAHRCGSNFSEETTYTPPYLEVTYTSGGGPTPTPNAIFAYGGM